MTREQSQNQRVLGKHYNFPSALPYLPAEPVFGRARTKQHTIVSLSRNQNVTAACELSIPASHRRKGHQIRRGALLARDISHLLRLRKAV